MLRRLLVLVVGIGLAAGAACLAAPAAGRPGTRIAAGVAVYGVPLGGFSSEPARTLLRRALERPVVLTVDGAERRVQPETMGLRASVDDAVAAALAADGPRAFGAGATADSARIRRYVARLDRTLSRRPRDAELVGLDRVRPRFAPAAPGRRVDRRRLAAAIAHALASGDRDPIAIRFRPVAPKVTARTFGPVVVIGRYANRLFLYDGPRLAASFPVATGQSRYPTPLGTFKIADLQRNPWWYPPPSDWAKGLKPVPPGPGNPLGTRWMGLDVYGVGIHGTPDAASLGYSASHGCIRMAIPSAEWLFERVRVGTPVVIAAA
ncbi:MAG TPA: L,D-transpeptidase [Gaiellaceae bacterium]|nr:L,D-transpeptidase [Gaiellaceae bacterium]